jgi:DNA-binding LacI/PurR family transcriptional regulator
MNHNIKEIAERAGVSRSTASRVISGKGYASQEVRARVMSVVEELQYKPSAVARAMVAQRTHNIGVIVFRERQPIVSHPLYGKLIDAILMAAEARGYSVFLKTDQEMSLRSTDYMMERRVDGLILISRLRKNVIDYVKSFNVPYLMVNGSTDDPEVIHLVSNDEEGGQRAAEHLHGLGHRRFLVIAGPQEHRSHNLRLEGFKRGLARLGGAEDVEIAPSPESGFEHGYRLMTERANRFLEAGRTAVFATNDMLALGAVKALLERGVDVPGQASVMGFDDVDHAAMYTPALTTVKVDTERMGRDAVGLLDRLIRKEGGVPMLNEYASELIVRQSTRPGPPPGIASSRSPRSR